MSVHPQDLAATMVRREARSQKAWEDRATEVLRRVEEEVARALSSGIARRAWIIGSLAWGSFGPESDVDLVVEGLGEAEIAALWDRLVECAGTRVDLLRLEALPEVFRARVLSDGRELHGA